MCGNTQKGIWNEKLHERRNEPDVHLQHRFARSLMRELREMRGYIGADQPELLNMTDSALQKLENISDKEFAELELYPDF